jgi:hypothetical protein
VVFNYAEHCCFSYISLHPIPGSVRGALRIGETCTNIEGQEQEIFAVSYLEFPVNVGREGVLEDTSDSSFDP